MILGILQARISSTRLPGKVLKPILGIPMLLHQIKRIQRAKLVDKLIVATSLEQADDELENMCKGNGIQCFRGSLEDVLERFYQAAKLFKPEHIVRLTGDCPLTDPEIIDQVIEVHLRGNFDYTSNALEPTYPDGLDVEVLRFSVLERARQEATLSSQREHVTLYIYQNPLEFKIGVVKGKPDLSALRWTVDEPQDFALVKDVYEFLYPQNPNFTTKDILEYINIHSELKEINNGFVRNEGLTKSLNYEDER